MALGEFAGVIADPARQAQGGSQRTPRNAGNELQKRMRFQAIQLLGGKCMRCGSTASLEFHHRVSEQSKNSYQRLKDVLANPQKFLLLCRVHHLDTHTRQLKMAGGRINPDDFMEVKAARFGTTRAPCFPVSVSRWKTLRLAGLKRASPMIRGDTAWLVCPRVCIK